MGVGDDKREIKNTLRKIVKMKKPALLAFFMLKADYTSALLVPIRKITTSTSRNKPAAAAQTHGASYQVLPVRNVSSSAFVFATDEIVIVKSINMNSILLNHNLVIRSVFRHY